MGAAMIVLSEARHEFANGVAQRLPESQQVRFWRAIYSRLDWQPTDTALWRVVGIVDREIVLTNCRAPEGGRRLQSVEDMVGTTVRFTEVDDIRLPALLHVNGAAASDVWPPPVRNLAVEYAQMVQHAIASVPVKTDAEREAEKVAEAQRMMDYYHEREAGRERLAVEQADRARDEAAERARAAGW
jgi:hypothetical protein